MIARATERMEDRLFQSAMRSAKRWQMFMHGLTDVEILGIAAAALKEVQRRGLDQ